VDGCSIRCAAFGQAKSELGTGLARNALRLAADWSNNIYLAGTGRSPRSAFSPKCFGGLRDRADTEPSLQ
jgi:hypothetical protein